MDIPKRTKWWKKVPTVPKLERPHVDRRGSLHVIASSRTLGTRFGSVVVISSKKGTIRANHRHRQDSHLCYFVTGRMLYVERKPGAARPSKRLIVKAGQAVFTPPGIDHAMKFLADSIFITVADRHRDQADYEKDLIRLNPPLIAR
ncbi:MAG: cupin domain-containing protein [Candidatus Coatesbacteria bacterium]